MLTRSELAAALHGLRRLVRFQPDAFGFFDATLGGFWKSFWAAALTLPVWALLQGQQMLEAPPSAPVRYLAMQAVAFAVSWLAYPLLMVRIAVFLDRWPRYFTYMVAYNWFQVAQALAWVPLLMLLGIGAPREVVVLVWLGTHATIFAYGWFIARYGLAVESGTAAALVIIDFLLGLLIDGVTATLM